LKNFIDNVNAGGPSHASCDSYQASFTILFAQFNASVYEYHDDAIAAIHAYVAANSSQPSRDFISGITSIGNKARTHIAHSSYFFFDAIAADMPRYTSDEIANFAFSDDVPDFPLSCLTDLHDIFYTFVLVEGHLDDIVDATLDTHSGKK
jgi:hypothetical protein